MDKLNKKKYCLEREQHTLKDGTFYISGKHEYLFKFYQRSVRKTKNIDDYIENMEESDKVVYEESISKDIHKFKG